VLTGTIGKADYRIEVPVAWNGTLFLYSHGLVTPDQPNPAQDAGGPEEVIAPWLMGHGFAIAGSAYSSIVWAVEDAFQDQMALLDFFQRHVGKPKRVIAWGHSLGGLITAGLIQLHPDRFAAAIPICGILAGGIAFANLLLDGAYAFRTLVAPGSDLQLAGSLNSGNLRIGIDAYKEALTTEAGQA
jgi:pimeloyl-ACP methyl ester carboxylesterase